MFPPPVLVVLVMKRFHYVSGHHTVVISKMIKFH